MSEEFNPNLDKITERDVVPDFYSRLKIGKPFANPDISEERLSESPDSIIFNTGTNVKIINEKIAMCLPTSILNDLNRIHITDVSINTDDALSEIEIYLPKTAHIILAYSEKTQIDLTNLFVLDEEASASIETNKYTMVLDTPYQNKDNIKFYYYKDDE